MKREILMSTAVLGLIVPMAFLSGCASTATGSSKSAVLMQSPAETIQNTAPDGSVLAVLRYPAVVESAAQDAYLEAFFESPIGGRLSAASKSSPEARSIADSVVLKSNYFALSLYEELVDRLPEHSVLLSPHAIKLDTVTGKLLSEPITKAESLPSVVNIDFSTYSFPDSEKMMGGQPLTFGDIITPLVVVSTDHRAEPSMQGVLLASEPLLKYAGARGRRAAMRSLASIQTGDFDKTVPNLAFVSYLNQDGERDIPVSGLVVNNSKNVAQVYPLEKVLLDRNALAELSADANADVDPLEDAFSSPLADRIVALLNDTDMQKAAMMSKATAVAQFDPSLAALTLAGSNNQDYKARLRYAERLLQAEQKYLSIQSLRIYDGIHNGEMGAQVRDMIKAEYDVLEQRRDLARKQNAAMAMAVLGAVAAGASMSGSGDGGYNYGDVLLTQTLANAAIFAATKSFSYKRQSAAVGSNYLTSIVPAIEEQITIQVNLLDSNETITAIRFEDLQEKLQTLYTENQRSLDGAATQCAFDGMGTGVKGVWMGVCNGGLAAGQGVGAISNTDGSAMEYFGTAVDGKPNGRGYMILHDASGSHGLEGNFLNGKANGVMLVSKARNADTLRQYENGIDIGAAPAGSAVPSPFDVAANPVDVTDL